jgi:serine/threonine protein kinase
VDSSLKGSSELTADMPLRALAPGQVLDGRYRLVERIGRGGFGDVWRAVELLPDGGVFRDVALKLLSPEVDSSNWAEEAKLLASFSHPSLVTIYATGVLERPCVPFVAMELLLGETLGDMVRRRGQLPWRLSLRFVLEVARALDVIHARDIIHLDLKPANIFLTTDGKVKVLDFGISKTRTSAGPRPNTPASLAQTKPSEASDDPNDLATAAFLAGSLEAYAETQYAGTGGAAPRVVVGTPGFVAPEILELRAPTMHADAYALGATLAVLTTGRLPQDVPHEPPDDGSVDQFRTYLLCLRDSTLRGALRNFDALGLPRGVGRLIHQLCGVDPERRGVSEGRLGAVIESVWEAPHGVPELPYPGLAPYSSQHEGFLFGREQDLVRAVRHLTFESIIVLAGPFGTGKTSFVQAALLPALEKSGIDGNLEVEVVHHSVASGPDTIFANRPLEDFLYTEPGVARVLFLDDAEELPNFAEGDRRLTVALIERLLSGGRRGAVRLVLAVEQEGLERLLELSNVLLGLTASVRYMVPPPEAVARDIAIEPALRAGLRVDGEKQIVETVAGELRAIAVPLPSIALILSESMSEPESFVPTQRAESDPIPSGPLPSSRAQVLTGDLRRLDGKLLQGGVNAAVHRAAERAWRGLAEDEEKALELLVSLTNSEGKLIRVPASQLADRLGLESIDPLLRKMQRRRLLSMRGVEVELAHPALASWSKLENARLSAMASIALRERISEAAAAWEKASMSAAYLARSSLVAEVDRLGLELRAFTGLEVEFLSESRRALRRARLWQLGAVVAAVALGVAGLWYRSELIARRLEEQRTSEKAQQKALQVGLVARARQAADPYERVAYFVAAIQAGASEPALFVELLGAAADLPPGRFLSLEPLDSLAMPWNDRWALGRSPAGSLVVFDLRSPLAEPETLDFVDVAADPHHASVVHRPPKRFEIAIGSSPVVDITPVPFDTSLFAQNADGEVQLVRLDESGTIALAAVVPFSCRGEMTVATRAPVFACSSAGDASIWNMATGETARVTQPAGIFALSPDGERIVTWSGREVSVVRPFSPEPALRFAVEGEVRYAAVSPRDPVVAILTDRELTVRKLEPDAEPLVRRPLERQSEKEAQRVVWDRRGLDVALCIQGAPPSYRFLMEGDRPSGLSEPSARCDGADDLAPDFLTSRFDLGDFAFRSFGEHYSRGAFQLPGDRYLSTTLLLAGGAEDGLRRVLEFTLRDANDQPEPVHEESGFTRVVRSGEFAIVELARTAEQSLARAPAEIVVASAKTGRRQQRTTGFLLDACEDGRVLAYRSTDDSYLIHDVRSAAEIAKIDRARGVVLGLSPSCEKLYTQDLDGNVYVVSLRSPATRKLVASARGHVYEAKRIAAFESQAAGLLLGVSSGEIVHVDETTDELRLLARANPRVTALAPGVLPGTVVFADQTGVYEIQPEGSLLRLAAPRIGSAWEDIVPAPQAGALVLASRSEVAILDRKEKAITGSARLEGLTRGLAWDESGAVLLFPHGLQGIARGQILPFGRELPEIVGALASNLRVSDSGLVLKR